MEVENLVKEINIPRPKRRKFEESLMLDEDELCAVIKNHQISKLVQYSELFIVLDKKRARRPFWFTDVTECLASFGGARITGIARVTRILYRARVTRVATLSRTGVARITGVARTALSRARVEPLLQAHRVGRQGR